jgi:hypothetical protein
LADNDTFTIGEQSEFEVRYPDGRLKERFRVTKQADGTSIEEILFKDKGE